MYLIKQEKTIRADDTKIQSGKGNQGLVSSEMKPVCYWFSKKFTNNPAKSEAMYFGRSKPEKNKIRSAEMDHKTSCKHFI